MLRYEIIQTVIDSVEATSYLEIGTYWGESFNEIECKLKLGVDIRNKHEKIQAKEIRDLANLTSEGSYYYQSSSDDFFQVNDRDFDLVFIDGDHSYPQSFRDIVNALEISDLVIVHDVLPSLDQYERQDMEVFNSVTHINRSSDVRIRTVDTDCGVAIIDKTDKVRPIEDYQPLSFEEFLVDRDNLVNIRSVDWFKEEYEY